MNGFLLCAGGASACFLGAPIDAQDARGRSSRGAHADLLAQDGFRAEDDLEINIKEITVVVAAIAQEEKESEQLGVCGKLRSRGRVRAGTRGFSRARAARAIQVAIEEHQAAVQDTDALRTRAEMALNVAMQMGASALALGTHQSERACLQPRACALSARE